MGASARDISWRIWSWTRSRRRLEGVHYRRYYLTGRTYGRYTIEPAQKEILELLVQI